MKDKKIALFPGSFDPFTKGHENVVEQALEVFDEIVIGIGVNSEKKYLFPLEKRIAHITAIYQNNERVSIQSYASLTVDFANDISATHLVRGLRNTTDFSYEQPIASINQQMSGIHSVFFLTRDVYAAMSSSIVREIFKNGKKIDAFVTNAALLV